MVLYIFFSNVSMYPALIHRLCVNCNERAVLFANAGMLGKNPQRLKYVDNFKEYKLFDDIRYLDVRLPASIWSKDENYAVSEIIKIYDAAFAITGYSLAAFDRIYILSDSWDVDTILYLNLKKINYYWIQQVINNDGEGGTKPGAQDYLNRINLIKSYKSQGWFSDLATPCLLLGSDKSIKRCNKDYEIWDINKNVNNLSTETLQLIALSYEFNMMGNTHGSTILVKNSWGYIYSHINSQYKKWYDSLYIDRKMKLTAMSLIDNIAIDYFTITECIHVKAHPNDPINEENLLNWYGSNAKLVVDMPFQIMSKLFEINNIKFNSILGYNSTSLEVIDNSIYDNSIILGAEFFSFWMQMHDIYAALKFAVDTFPEYDVYCHKSMTNIVDLLLNMLGSNKNSKLKSITDCSSLNNSFVIFNDTFYASNCYSKISNSVTLCFIDTFESMYFYDDRFTSSYHSISVKKTKLHKTLDPCRESAVWLFSTSSNLANIVDDFSFTKELRRTGVLISATQKPISEMYDAFEAINFKRQLSELVHLRELKKRIKVLFQVCATSLKMFPFIIKSENDFLTYLQLINKQKENYLIIFAVADTPGNHISNEIVSEINELGFSNFIKTLWATYIGVCKSGEVLFNLTTLDEKPTNYLNEDMNLVVSSHSWRNGNKAEIVIGGIDYAVSKRGINIVIWDLVSNSLVDSVAFDAHISVDAFCYR